MCGAAGSDFDVQSEPPAATVSAPAQWRCLICGYIHMGAQAPEACPVCGASADEFEPESLPQTPAVAASADSRRIVVVGGGIAALAAVESLRDVCPAASITMITKEPVLPYYRLNLTRYLAGEVGAGALPIHPETWYTERRIRLRLAQEVVAVRPDAHTVELAAGEPESYDTLILACGAHAFVPPIEGVSLDGVSVLRTRADADRILAALRPGASWIIVGGGILGLEAAGALAQRGVGVTVLENADRLLPRQLDKPAAERLHAFVAAKGIQVRYQAKTQAIEGDGKVRAVRLADGTGLAADGVIVAAGIRANSHLARKAGLEVNQGIVVDARLASSDPDIYAAGDAAEHRGIVYGLWEPARHQGAIAGMNAGGIVTEFGGLPRANTLKVLGIDLFSIGIVDAPDGSFDVFREDAGTGYFSFLFRDGRLAGAILVGDTRLSAALAKAVKSQQDCSALLRGAVDARVIQKHFAEA